MPEVETRDGKREGGARRRRVLLWCCLALLGIAAAGGAWLADYANSPGPSKESEIVVLIPSGASFERIAAILADAGVINDDIRFEILARLHGYAGSIHAGEFALPGGMLPLDLLKTLKDAKVLQHPVTVAEGLRATEIAALFEKGGWCSYDDFITLVKDQQLIQTLGLGGLESLEGYLYPDTYYLTRIPSFDARKIIKMMVGRFFQIWDELDSGDAPRHETVILASIVEKETGAPEERAIIASVFHNRLDKGMRLQSDPTVIYGIEDFSGNLTKNHLRTPTPYNTYVVKGLPQGPICNPGMAALAAVLNPAREDYLYFVSKNDGTHHFSKTLREHNRAVSRYQKRKRE